MELHDKKLIVQRASVGARAGPLSGTNPAVLAPVQLQVPGLATMSLNAVPQQPTEVLCLMNMVTVEELENDEDYDDILDDIKQECDKEEHRVMSIEIPRPIEGVDVPGVGKVFFFSV